MIVDSNQSIYLSISTNNTDLQYNYYKLIRNYFFNQTIIKTAPV